MWMKIACLNSVFVLVFFVACSDEPTGEFTTDLEVPEREPLPLESSLACALDSDCSSGLFCFQGGCARECVGAEDCDGELICSARGRCVRAEGSEGEGGDDGAWDLDDPGVDIDVEPGIALYRRPERLQQIAPGQEVLNVEVTVTPASSVEALTYRVERTDEQGDSSSVRRVSGTTEFTIPIETGAANPESEAPELVEVSVITSAGAFRLSLIPQLPCGGTYSGTARIEQFGQIGLPIDFQVVTDPPEASLEAAEAAWVVMPVGPEKLFSPHEPLDPESADESMTAELVADEFTGRWVAVFVNEFRMGEDALLASATIPGQVRRALRLELEQFGERQLIGAISDRWTGLYDRRPELGEPMPANVTFEGTLELTRIDDAPHFSEVTPPEDLGDANPQPLPAPSLEACLDEHLLVAPIDEYGCEGLATVADFQSASAAERANCAIAVARTSLLSETTARQIAAFLDDTDPGGESFAEFMERCAAGTDGTCRPTAEVLCARQLTAYAFFNLDEDGESAAELTRAYQETTREVFLGQQLGAFQTDARTRLEWLQSTDYPAIVTSAVQDLIAQLLDEWSDNVLDVHLGVLAGQLDTSGLAVLSQGAETDEALAARQQLLMEMSQSWRGAAEALTLATIRWNELFQDTANREERTVFVSQRMFDLYLMAGVLNNLNRDSGASFASGAFASGFGNLMRHLSELRLPFDRLIYARDAEVVVSTSVDPLSDNSTLLRERQEDALAEIEDAAEAVGAIIEDAQAEALEQEQLTNRMSNEINEFRGELVDLCGLPVGCTTDSVGTDPSCQVRVEPGQCGFLIQHETEDYFEFDTGVQSVSEGGSKLLEVRGAMLDLERAEEELRAHTARVNLHLETTEAFAAQVQQMHSIRSQRLEDMNAAIAVRQQERSDELEEFLDNIEARSKIRQENLEGWAADLEAWDEIRLDGVVSDFKQVAAATALESTATIFRDTADATDSFADAVARGMPKCVGTSSDPSAPARLAALIGAWSVTFGLRQSAAATEMTANILRTNVEKEQALREAELTHLEAMGELSGAVSEAEVARLAELAEASSRRSAAADAALRELLEMMEETAEAELAFQRDLIELSDRQSAMRDLLIDSAGLEIQVRQAELGIEMALQNYMRVAQRAQLRAARLEELERQRAEINSLIGSPAVVFAWANRLEQADGRLQRAKDALMDWLVALEYLAVRPFVDLRLQILLARNTYQLEAIAAEIERLQGRCGGPTTRHVSELSVRDDLLGLSLTLEDPVTGELSSPPERFRALLERGYVPIDKRVRYTTDSSVGELLSRRSVWSGTFEISLDDFANLGASCNAKVASMSVQLVGEELGDAQPTVTVLYDGSSQLRSCQPGLDEYLDAIGRESTSYGSVTRLYTSGRSISMVAGINEFSESSTGNLSLAGLPLASRYTVLIDPEMGENRDIDWSRLDDVVLRIEYSYQDLFPEGQCQ